jgi:TRAP transporter 4TM/12TM fusion protein
MNKVQTITKFADSLFYLLACSLTAYMAISTFVFIQTFTQHYSTIMLGVIVLSSIRALRDVLRKGQLQPGLKFWLRLSVVAIMLISAVVSTSYIRLNALRLEIEQPFLNDLDVVMGVIFLIAILLANWFFWGSILTGVIAVGILYFLFGHLIEFPLLKHPHYNYSFVMSYMGMNTTEGAFAYIPDGVEKLYFIVVFSAVMLGSGMINLVIEIGKLIGRQVKGGAAFPAVIGSSLVGTVMGAAVTNVILTGQFTIPMMKHYGFKKEFAGAIEAAASTAGQLIPPVMGLAAFIMAAFLNIPYINVAKAAVIPSFLYVTGVSISILIKAQKENMPKLQESINITTIRQLLPSFIIPFLVVLILLLMYYSPSIAGLFGIVAVLLICPFQGSLRPSLKQMNDAFKDGLETTIGLSLLMIAVGPLAQTFITTNLSGHLSNLLVLFLPNIKILLLIGAMLLALLLGMGMPTPVAYIICALTLGHFIIETGVEAFSAHFFIQYFAVFSALTPPVALASMAASKLAGGSFVDTSIESLKLVFPSFWLAFAFVYNPKLLAFPKISISVLILIGMIIGTQWTWNVMVHGYFRGKLSIVHRSIFGLITILGIVYLVHSKIIFFYVFTALSCGEILWSIAKESRYAKKYSFLNRT